MQDEVAFTGEAVIETSLGDLCVGLFCREMPATTLAFIRRSLRGDYDNVRVTRITPRFCVQFAPPAASEDAETPLELHSRLRFARRGLLGMSGARNGFCGAAFFITLDRTAELDERNTLFGALRDLTVYNLAEMEAFPRRPDLSPAAPIVIRRVAITQHPFDLGAVPRCVRGQLAKPPSPSPEKSGKRAKHFTISAAEDEDQPRTARTRSFQATHGIAVTHPATAATVTPLPDSREVADAGDRKEASSQMEEVVAKIDALRSEIKELDRSDATRLITNSTALQRRSAAYKVQSAAPGAGELAAFRHSLQTGACPPWMRAAARIVPDSPSATPHNQSDALPPLGR